VRRTVRLGQAIGGQGQHLAIDHWMAGAYYGVVDLCPCCASQQEHANQRTALIYLLCGMGVLPPVLTLLFLYLPKTLLWYILPLLFALMLLGTLIALFH
jgi:VIT1/CCC1 family predicted Fe2+/Mn2+ transporter